MKFSIVEFPRGMSAMTEAKRTGIAEGILKQALDAKQIYKGGILSSVNTDMIKDLLKRMDRGLYDELFFMLNSSVDFSMFRDAIISRIEELLENRTTAKKIIKLPLLKGVPELWKNYQRNFTMIELLVVCQSKISC